MEKQFSERQLIRWAVPGWIVLFIVAVIIFIHTLFDEQLWNSFACFFSRHDALGEIAAIGGAVIAAGFALGFILFQIYFVIHWRGPKCCSVVGMRINYINIINFLNNNNLFVNDFGEKDPIFYNSPITRLKKENAFDRQNLESYASAAWWRFVSNTKEKRTGWENRNSYLFSVYHSLGTIIIGIYLTALAYNISIILIEVRNTSNVNWLSYSIIMSLLFLLAFIFVLGRNDTSRAINNLIRHALFYSKVFDKKAAKCTNLNPQSSPL